MKKTVIFVVMLLLMLCLCTCGKPPEAPKPDYIKMLTDAAYSGDTDLGGRIEALLALNGEYVGFTELCILSRFLNTAYSDSKYSDELRFYAGEVILNRMASDEYPDGMDAVISQMGYDVDELLEVQPRKSDIRIAIRLLKGERFMKDSVVIISDAPLENPYATFCDALRGNIYFGESYP